MKPVIGITGSCGKTSTKEMLRLLLGEASTHATSGNWNNRIGVPMTLFDLDPPQHDFAVIEAGINQPGEMAMLGQMIHADLSILTNIGPAHLELLGSLDGIAEEKSKLASCAKPDAPLVLPLAALQYSPYAKMAKRCIALRFGEAEVPDGLGELVDCSIESSRDGTAYRLLIDGDRYEVMSSSLGIAQNAALAIVAARRLGISSGLSAKRIAEWSPESTRGRIVSLDSAYFYIDCYNANPASMADAIKAFQKTAPADLPRCYVLGAMNELGVSSADYHLTVGAGLALRPQDMAVFVGPQGLTEAYLCGAKKSGAEQNQIECVQNTKEAESIVAEFKGALFLKGSRSYQLESLLSESIP